MLVDGKDNTLSEDEKIAKTFNKFFRKIKKTYIFLLTVKLLKMFR